MDYYFIYTPVFNYFGTVSAIPRPLSADFESGKLNAWSGQTIGGGDLSVIATGSMVNNKALRAVINDNVVMHLTDESPNAESHYRARFYFDPNSSGMALTDSHLIFYGYQGATLAVLRVELRFYNGFYQVRGGALNDGTLWQLTP